MMIQRFTAFRRNLAAQEIHTDEQRNEDHEPQFEGVIWSDGTVTLRWLTPCQSHSIWPDIETCLKVHGHPEYGTQIIWHDGVRPRAYVDMMMEYEAAD